MAGRRHGRKSGNSTALKTVSRGGKRKTAKRRAALTITNGCFAGLEIALTDRATSLGRNISCDICLDHGFVSEEHAIIRRANGGYEIEDLNSRHGTSVNGEEIHRKSLKNGDRIVIGNFELKFSC